MRDSNERPTIHADGNLTAHHTPGAERPSVVLHLRVRNHPGVMSHVCGLFHRRLFNVEGIACLPTADASRSAVLLLVREDQRLEQVVRQLARLADVLEIHREATRAGAFDVVAGALGCPVPR